MSQRGNSSMLDLVQQTCDFSSPDKDYKTVTANQQPERTAGVKTMGSLSAEGSRFRGLDIIDYGWLLDTMEVRGVPEGDWYD